MSPLVKTTERSNGDKKISVVVEEDWVGRGGGGGWLCDPGKGKAKF